MVADRALSSVLSDFSTTVAEEFAVADVLRRLAEGAVRVLDLDGAGVMVPHQGQLLRFAFATGRAEPAVTVLERLQEQLQEGPCGDSHRGQRTIDIADLAAEGTWPQYRAAAVAAGLPAVTTLPLLARGRSWGVLDLYRSRRRRLDPDELAAATTLAQVATSYLVVMADRDVARAAQQELAHRAMHDPLTGLPVRWVFLEQLTQALARLERHPGQVGVLFADLDGLKHVNDTWGHDAGDRLLRTSVQRIRRAVRPTDVLARVGGDEFVVLLQDLDDRAAAVAVVERILSELARPYRPDGHVIQPSASLGLALTDDPGETPAALVAHADSAMYRAKRAGRGRYEVFDAATSASDRARGTLREDTAAMLRAGLHDRQIGLHYQPIVDISRAGPGRYPLYGLEALARWQHPGRGLLAAQDFVPQAESAGLMPEIGAVLLAAACAQLVAWDRELGARAPERLFVNVSADELSGADFPRHLAAVLRDTGVAPSRLTLEITETGLVVDPAAAARSLAAARELGCPLAIDDVGTGYSSLSRLVDLPADTWKIDGSFSADLAGRPTAAAVVAAVLQLGRQLDRDVVVEGVEDDATVRALRRVGCRHAQGHHLGRPLPAPRTAELFAARADPPGAY